MDIHRVSRQWVSLSLCTLLGCVSTTLIPSGVTIQFVVFGSASVVIQVECVVGCVVYLLNGAT